ncbi:MAG: OmpH family outer membrane protein [Tannerella sp.]|jgi:outer membrane protein|nr:OmpH family outer membrane protein [Tannerella sp.]
MKHVSFVTNGILAIVIFVLFSQCTEEKQTSSEQGSAVSENPTSGLRIAYINVDSLLLSYNFSIDLTEQIVRKRENATANYTQKARAFQSELENFQYKYQHGAFATQARAEQEQQRLQKKQQELQELDEKLSQELIEESQRMNEQLRDTIVSHLKEYNKIKGYHLILSNEAGSPVFLADDSFNITSEVIEFLNKRWSSPSSN